MDHVPDTSRWQRPTLAGAAAFAVLACLVVGMNPALVGLGPSPTASRVLDATPSLRSNSTELGAAAASIPPSGEGPEMTRGPADPTAVAEFHNEAGGYEAELPAAWLEGLVADDVVELAGVVILAGGRDRHLDTCPIVGTICKVERVTNLAQLEDAVGCVPTTSGLAFREHHADTTLGGEPARIESVNLPRKLLAGPPAWYCVYAMHARRPYVLAFDYWSIRYRPFFAEQVDKIIASFRFLD